jgi:TetR/AcrR family transcriptional repressor of nem operon
VGHSQEEKAASRRRIVEITSARLREEGSERPAIGELMKAADLTHGGFYRHFGSRDELVDEAIETALADGSARMAAVARSKRKGDPFAALIDAYLSERHRDCLADSCAVATLAADVARGSERARSAYTKQVEDYLSLFEEVRDEPNAEERRRRALLDLSALVGAISLARAVVSDELSDELLREVASALKR